MKRTILYLALVILFLLHQDFWLWNDPALLFGFLPVGLAYHILFCLLTSLLWYVVVTQAWSSEAEVLSESAEDEKADSK